MLVNVAFRSLADGRDEIFGMHVYNPMDRPLEEINRFSLEGKGTVHYLFLFACLAVPFFILFTLVVAIRTRFNKRKWAWILFILVGFVQFSINWTTGQIGVKPLSFQLFGAGALSASVFAPWILSVSLPIGAVLFWIKREGLRFNVPPLPDER